MKQLKLVCLFDAVLTSSGASQSSLYPVGLALERVFVKL